MTTATVERILDLIDDLKQEERDVLQQRLDERAETEWRKEAEEARRQALARGIDQTAIDAAIHTHRYGT